MPQARDRRKSMDNGLHKRLEYQEYRDVGRLSPSALARIWMAPEKYNRVETKTTPAMEFGTLCHTLILEPGRFADRSAIWTGKMRRGKAWEEFKETNSDRDIYTLKDIRPAQ